MNTYAKKPSREITLADRLEELTRFSELKQLVYNIAALQQEKGFRTLAILSCFAGEGKTLFCAALARSYAETSRTKVLVVDTTTFHNPKSLILRQCLDPASPLVDILPLERNRNGNGNGSNGTPRPSAQGSDGSRQIPAADVIKEGALTVSAIKESDQSLIRKAAEEGTEKYGLILLDTVPLTAKNKNNIDPLLVAHLSDASILVVSRKLLNTPYVQTTLKILEDPTIHLIGMISNEEVSL